MFSILLIVFIFFLLFSFYIIKKKLNYWLPAYIKRLFFSLNSETKNKPIDLMVLWVDHFELNGHKDRLKAWSHDYPILAKRHKDSDGHHPKHTFFYAMDLMHEHELKALQHLVADGFGEFELHWHHDHDNERSFIHKMNTAFDIFHQYGYMKPYQTGKKACFAFIHGNWSLANSRGKHFCGVDNEIDLLQKMGCYADYTFPALFSEAQPPWINAIYYTQKKNQAKSYFKGRESRVGQQTASDEFMIFQGPLTINWRDWRHHWHPTIENGDINEYPTHDDPKRIRSWIKQKIHVKGAPNWQFIKLFSHGAQDYRSVVSKTTEKMFHYFESHYNDNVRYRLHYVTAREAYNIVKAAEDGKKGNPNNYRNYIIPSPLSR
jgi:hypothetical protein